ncbi:hypothetical protein D3C84_624110 [compost metagenome]
MDWWAPVRGKGDHSMSVQPAGLRMSRIWKSRLDQNTVELHGFDVACHQCQVYQATVFSALEVLFQRRLMFWFYRADRSCMEKNDPCRQAEQADESFFQ